MALSVCIECNHPLSKTATNCQNCGYVPVLVSVRNFLIALIGVLWAFITRDVEKFQSGFFVTFLIFSILVLMSLLSVSFYLSAVSRFKRS